MRSLLFIMAGILQCFFSLVQAEAIVGQKAPDFSLKGADGKTYSLGQFANRVIVLEWLNHGCPFVKKHYGAGNMQKLQRKWSQAGSESQKINGKPVVWLSIISSAPGKQGHVSANQALEDAKIHKSEGLAILLDEKGIVGRKFGAKTTPHMFIIGEDGLVQYAGAIDSVASAEQEDIPDAINYIDAALSSIQQKEKIKVSKTNPYGCSVKYE